MNPEVELRQLRYFLAVAETPPASPTSSYPEPSTATFRARTASTIDIGIRAGSDKILPLNFMQIAREHLRSPRPAHPRVATPQA
jgi:hypothetical protein